MHLENDIFVRLPAIDFEEIRTMEKRIQRAERARNTQLAYAHGWKMFLAWCAAAERSWLPAAPPTVQDYATWCIARGHRLGTIFLRMTAIAHYHREAGFDTPCTKDVRLYLANARRELREEPAGKDALSYDLLRGIASGSPETAIGIRNKAMILVGFAAGWRRSEVIGLRRSDLHFVPEGIALWQRFSKTDQTGKGRWVGIAPGERPVTCPVRALEAWIDRRGDWPGPLFSRITRGGKVTRRALAAKADVLNKALKRSLEAMGEDPNRFGAHSLRAGMITEAGKHGASESSIMLRTGHHCSESIRRYTRPARIFDFNPLKGVL